jgi:hypothetical protein
LAHIDFLSFSKLSWTVRLPSQSQLKPLVPVKVSPNIGEYKRLHVLLAGSPDGLLHVKVTLLPSSMLPSIVHVAPRLAGKVHMYVSDQDIRHVPVNTTAARSTIKDAQQALKDFVAFIVPLLFYKIKNFSFGNQEVMISD